MTCDGSYFKRYALQCSGGKTNRVSLDNTFMSPPHIFRNRLYHKALHLHGNGLRPGRRVHQHHKQDEAGAQHWQRWEEIWSMSQRQQVLKKITIYVCSQNVFMFIFVVLLVRWYFLITVIKCHKSQRLLFEDVYWSLSSSLYLPLSF